MNQSPIPLPSEWGEKTRSSETLDIESIVAPWEIRLQIEDLIAQGELTQTQGEMLFEAMDVTSNIHDTGLRRDGFRNSSVGHVYPATMALINNRGWVVETVLNDNVSFLPLPAVEALNHQPVHPADTDRREVLYRSILLMLAHDWFEDYKHGGNYGSTDDFRSYIGDKFGQQLRDDIEVLTKKPKSFPDNLGQRRNINYRNQLEEGGKAIHAIVKYFDRAANHNDDFGMTNTRAVLDYVSETRQILIPWLKRYIPLEQMDAFELMLEDLDDNAINNGYLTQKIKDAAEFLLDGKRDDGTTQYDHTTRMIRLLKTCRLRETAGMVNAIRLHDLVQDGVLLPNSETFQFLQEIATETSDSGVYAIGIALASRAVERMLNTQLRDISHTYEHLEGNKTDAVKHIYSRKVFMTEGQLREAGVLRVEPLAQNVELYTEFLQYDIEALLLVVLEKLDNFEHPSRQNGKENAANKWKAAQELSYLQPILEVGGFSDLAQYIRGRALEFLYGDSVFRGRVEEESARYGGFMRENGLRFSDSLRGARNLIGANGTQKVSNEGVSRTWPIDSVVTINLKAPGSAIKKMEDSQRRTPPEEPNIGDYVRARVILPETVRHDDPLFIQHVVSQILQNLTEDFPGVSPRVQHSRSRDTYRSIKIRTSRENAQKANEILPSLSPLIDEEVVQPGQYECTNMIFRIDNIPDFPDGFFFEVQIINQEPYRESIVGSSAHTGFKRGDGTQLILPAEITKVLHEIYYRMAIYRISPHAVTYLSRRSIEMLEALHIEGVDLTKSVFRPSEKERSRLMNLLPYIA